MKKIIFAALCTVITNVATSQIYKGQFMVGGDAGFSSSKAGNFTSNTFQFNPDFGYFVINNLALGLRGSILSENEKMEGQSGTDKYSNTSVGPFARYYFLPATQKTNVFAEAGYFFGNSKFSGSNSRSLNGFSIQGGPAFFVTPNVAIEIIAGYNSFKLENASDRTNSFNGGVGFQIHLGTPQK